jgi:aspartate/methionine/tyrosine aminotransferase
MELTRIQKAIQNRQDQGLSIVNLSFADFTFYDSLLARRKIQNAFINIFKYPYYYPTARGEQEALQAISDYYGRLGQEVDPGSIILTSSVNQSFLYLLKIFSADGGEILIPRPHSPSLDEVSGFLDLDLKTFPLSVESGWQIDLEKLEQRISDKTRAIFLMSPHLPTGAIQKKETLEKLLKLIKGKDIALIMDETLSDFIFTEEKLPVIAGMTASRQLVVTLQTLSNSFALPGLKISWMQVSGPAEKAESLLQSIEFMADTFLTLNQLSQTILPEVVRYSRRWRKKFQKVVEKNRHILAGKLSKCPRLKFHYPEGGFYVFLEVLPDPHLPPADTVQSDEDFVVELLEKTGIYVHPGRYYGQKEGCYFMICFLQDPGILRNSLKKIVKHLRVVRI